MKTLLLMPSALILVGWYIFNLRKKKERNKKLLLLRKSAEEELWQLITFLLRHIDIYYQKEDAATIENSASLYVEAVELHDELELKTKDFNEEIADYVEKQIAYQKKQMEFNIDFMGVKEDAIRDIHNRRERALLVNEKTRILYQIQEIKIYWCILLFGKILPPYKKHSDLIVQVEAFLEKELVFYEFAKSCNQFKSDDLRIPIVRIVLKFFDFPNSVLFAKRFAPFLE